MSEAPLPILGASQMTQRLLGEQTRRLGDTGHPRSLEPGQHAAFSPPESCLGQKVMENTKSYQKTVPLLHERLSLFCFIRLVHFAQKIRTLWTVRSPFVNPFAAIFPAVLSAVNAFKHLSVPHNGLNGRGRSNDCSLRRNEWSGSRVLDRREKDGSVHTQL